MINKKVLLENKKLLVEIIIACALLVAEIIWALVYGISVLAPRYLVQARPYIEYFNLYLSHLLMIFLNVDILYIIVVILLNYKSEKYNKVFEIFLAALLLAVEVIIFLYCRYSVDQWHVWMVRYSLRLLAILAQINVVYIIVLLIIHSEKFKLSKAVIVGLIVFIEFITIWLLLINMTYKVDGDSLNNYKTFMIALAVFASIWVLYAVGLKVFDFVYGRVLKKKEDNLTVTALPSDSTAVNQ